MVGEFPTDGQDVALLETVDFENEVAEFSDGEDDDKPLSGRRKKAARDKQKKFKPGSFGKTADST